MRARVLVVSAVALAGGLAMTQKAPRHNPVIELTEAKKPVFGFYAPANRGGGRRGGAPDTTPRKTPAQLAADAVAYKSADLIFDGGMEGSSVERFDASYRAFGDFVAGMTAAGVLQRSPLRLSHPLFVKTPKISTDTVLAADRIARQLNLGVSGIVFVDVESAAELRQGLAMMRFKSNGGTRPDNVGNAPAFWGMTERDYKAKADLWPLNPNGELVNWTIVESREGLANVREIAAVKGIGALFVGAGTLARVIPDTTEREAAFRSVLAACREFNVPCGFPVGNPQVMERRMKEGWSVFIINWGEQGFQAAERGRSIANSPR